MPYYADDHLANVGSKSYQKLWLANAKVTLRARHFNGVYIDSVLGYITLLSPVDALPDRRGLGESDQELHRLRRAEAEEGRLLRAREHLQGR